MSVLYIDKQMITTKDGTKIPRYIQVIEQTDDGTKIPEYIVQAKDVQNKDVHVKDVQNKDMKILEKEILNTNTSK